MKKLSFPLRIFSIILIFTAVLFPLTVSAAESGSVTDYSVYDLSKYGSKNNVEINASDFIAIIDGSTPVSDIEKSYLLDYSYINVKYDTPTSQYVTVTAKDDVVYISANPYSYMSVTGQRVTWYPVFASVHGMDESVSLIKDGNVYTGVLNDVAIDDTTSVKVQYKMNMDLTIAKDDMNGALNSAFNTASSMRDEYNRENDAYNKAYSEYLKYLEVLDKYNADNEKYEQYLKELTIYREALISYNKYLEDVASYEDKMTEYEKYLELKEIHNEYVQYIENYKELEAKYQNELDKYNEYLGNLDLVKEQLNMLDTGLYDKVTDLQRDLYSCMFAGLVDQVVENKDAFVTGAKANPYAIDGANTATANIRKILKEYEQLESEVDKYGFYISNYDSIKENFSLLAVCLYDLYDNKLIRTRMHSEGKTEKYVIMIAQLVLFSNALTDGPVSVVLPDKDGNDRTITLNKNTTVTYLTGTQQPYVSVTENMLAILDNNEYVPDIKNPTPLDGGYPQKMEIPTPPVSPDDIEEPYNPPDMQRPVAPAEVKEPLAPIEVAKPDDIKHMDEPVKDPILTDKLYLDAIAALDNGAIRKRAELNEDFIFTPEVTVVKNVISNDNVTVTFYDHDNTTVLSRIITTKYSYVTYEGSEPTKEQDDLFAYYFDGWVYADGSAADLTFIEENVDVYPSFRTVDIVHLEFYDADNNPVYNLTVEKGDRAEFVGDLPIKIDETAKYTFDCWVDEHGNKYDLDNPTVSAKLYPSFTKIPYIFVTFHADDGSVISVEKILPGETVVYKGERPAKDSDNEADYIFTHWIDKNGSRRELNSISESIDLYPSFVVVSYITLTFHGADGEIIAERRVLKGVSYAFDGEIPTKDSDNDADYVFVGWIDKNGNKYDLKSPDAPADLYPEFKTVKRVMLRFYDTDGQTLIYELRVQPGSSVFFEGTEPIKATDSVGAYTFSHWVDEQGKEYSLDSVSESANLYPYFNLTPYVTVTFYGADGTTVLYTQTVLRGEAVSYGGLTPEKPFDPEADYSFAGYWLDSEGKPFDLSTVKESVDVYPQFNTTRYIVVNFYAYDRITILESFRVRPGQSIIYGDTPTRAGDDDAEYVFSHWVDENGEEYNFERLGYSADFYPVFIAIPYVTVTFYGEDRVTVLAEMRVLKGNTVIYNGAIPEKEGDEKYGYKFACWTYENGAECDLSSIDESANLYSSFVAIPYVTVTFMGTNGSELYNVRVLKGESITFVGDLPARESTIVADYVFDGWADGNGELCDLSAVSKDVVLYPFFKAVYKEYDLDPDYNGTGIAQLTVNLGSLDFNDIPAERFISVAESNRGSLLIVTDEISLRFSYAAVSAMKEAGVVYINADVVKAGSGYRCSVVLKDANERAITDNVAVAVSFAFADSEFANSASIVYTDSNGKRHSVLKRYENGVVAFDAYATVRYDMVVMHDVDVSKKNPITLEVDLDRAEPGATVKLSVLDNVPAGKILEVYYLDSNAVKHVIENGSFIMPDSSVTIGATLTDIIYTVTFISDGKVLSKYEYKYGETVIVPRDPTKQNDSNYSYVFAGWSEEISEVTRDVTYYARFNSTLLEVEDDDGIQIADNYLRIIKMVVIVVAVLIMTVLVIIFTRRPRSFAPF